MPQHLAPCAACTLALPVPPCGPPSGAWRDSVHTLLPTKLRPFGPLRDTQHTKAALGTATETSNVTPVCRFCDLRREIAASTSLLMSGSERKDGKSMCLVAAAPAHRSSQSRRGVRRCF